MLRKNLYIYFIIYFYMCKAKWEVKYTTWYQSKWAIEEEKKDFEAALEMNRN